MDKRREKGESRVSQVEPQDIPHMIIEVLFNQIPPKSIIWKSMLLRISEKRKF